MSACRSPEYLSLQARLVNINASVGSTLPGHRTNISPALQAERKLVAGQMNELAFPLPFEILSIISTLYVSSGRQQDHPTRQLCLASVCTLWRDVCFSLGDLWTSFYIHANTQTVLNWSIRQTFAGVALEWVSRAGTYPVHLRLDQTFLTCEYDDPACTACRFIPIVAGQLATLDMPLMGVCLRSQTPPCFPQLQSLTLRAPDQQPTRLMPLRACTFLDAPMLEMVKLHRPGLRLSIDMYLVAAIPWAQLRHLELRQASMNVCVALLARCSQLLTLDILSSGVLSHEPMSLLPVDLPRLQTLRFTESLSQLFIHLHMPALQDIELVELQDVEVKNLVASLVSPQRGPWISTPRRMQVVNTHTYWVVRLLALVPSLTTLEMTIRNNDRDFKWHFLGHLRHTDNFLPNLRTLKIKTCPMDVFPMDLVTTVKRRFDEGVLKQFSVDLVRQHGRERRKEEMILAFWDLADEGLEVQVDGEVLHEA
ncbi:hypothetical protein HMN09_00569200 [Mycena chlorophos]|uniref:F-box domain-containing protein n=1 Tax=Mycena chlorophos TaxID=658473 RepID=A0A8H6WEX9_MYCCL|nr:hypothetical protein HMN09_00569200 [Mycena chlorophos]